ncbi:MAG: hypothetical protein IKX68_09370 [Clostridiales bacterium]|nr:hypothetical protein [Clostridiales bacterium]
MKKIRLIRLICVIVLAVILIVASLFILIPKRNDSSSGRAAICFVHEDIMFPQMDYSQMFSRMDIASYYVIDDSCSKEEMQKKIDKVSAPKGLILFCEGDYALPGLEIAAESDKISDLFLVSPELDGNADLGDIGTTSPSCRVAIFAESGKTADSLYERLSGEDTKFTSGTRSESSAPELFLSSDANRYFARTGSRSNPEIASVIVLNNPQMQTYMVNYIKNHILLQKGVSKAPLLTWSMKMICTIFTVVSFFVYAATLPPNKKLAPANAGNRGGGEDGAGTRDATGAGADPATAGAAPELARNRSGKLRGRSIAEKYRSALNHLLALQGFLGVLFALVTLFFILRKQSAYQVVLLLWVCVTYLSSAFFLMPFLKKVKNRKVRSNRSMWPIHAAFTFLLAGVFFMLTLLWKGAGFLKLDIFLLVEFVLSIMVFVSITMLQLCDNFFGRIQGSGQSVLDSVKFLVIRLVPMVIVFVFSIIMKRELFAIKVLLLAISLLLASYMRRIVKRGALGETLSVVLFSCLYWMMF